MTLASGCNTGRQTAPHPLARYRSEFAIFRDRIYLNTCSLGALGERTRRRVAEFLDVWDARGAAAWYDVWWAALAELRARYAGVIGATAEEIALAPSISVALSAVAEALDYTRRPKVVVTSLDFPTVAYQWLAKRARGVELVVVESPDHVSVPVEAIARAVDERTALVATSHVYFTSGAIQDIRAVAHAAHVRGALCLIDAYQAVGQVPCVVRAWDCAFLTAGFRPKVAARAEDRSAIVMLPADDPADRVRHLAAAGIIADARPGHVRLSPFFYNVQDDYVAALERLAAQSGH